MQIAPQIVEHTLQPDVYQACLELGLSKLQARIVAHRKHDLDQLSEILFPKLQYIQHPNELKNSAEAAQRIADAIQNQELIVLATDYDTDGVTSAWVAMTALVDYFNVPADRVRHIIGERKSGYGITDEVVQRILALPEQVGLVISADQGSSDEARIAVLKSAGIDVCVTDHHHMPVEGPPPSAVCTVNPQQEGCAYDKTVAGCFVIFLVMTQVRQALIERGLLPKEAPSLKALTRNVALGTIADSVSLQSPNNRAIVLSGLNLINQSPDPAWQAMRQLNDNQGKAFNAEYLAFQVATRINAASRVSDVTTAFDFLSAKNLTEAQLCLTQLDEDNTDRRAQQQTMLELAKERAEGLMHDNKYSLAVKLEGNAGIQGIIATRIGEQYGLPCVAMTDLEDGFLAGSGRAIVPELDLRQCFQWMSEQDSELFTSMGGHKGAAGCMIPIEKYAVFAELFETAVQNQLGDTSPTPILETDGELDDSLLIPELMPHLEQLEPFGREWPQPVFHGRFTLMQIRRVGQLKNHLSCRLRTDSGKVLQSIYFNAIEEGQTEVPFSEGEQVMIVYHPSLNHFGGRTQLQLRVKWMSTYQ